MKRFLEDNLSGNLLTHSILHEQQAIQLSDLDLLKQMCAVQAPSGNESPMTQFVLDYVDRNKHLWKVQPEVLYGDDFQDCVMLVFGKPKTAIFAHLDSIGFMVRYGNELVKIGSPKARTGYKLVGKDSQGEIEAEIVMQKQNNKHKNSQSKLTYKAERPIERGTELVYKADFREDDDFVQSPYMDNRLGCWNALKVAETLENGIIAFSCWEEVGGGAVAYLAKYMYAKYGVKKALISDITWVTKGVHHGHGVVISLRDSLVPRRSFVNRIVELAKQTAIPFQLEVEDAGSSDAKELQRSDIPFDWCFIGAPEDNVHSPEEKVHKKDIQAMLELYRYLMKNL